MDSLIFNSSDLENKMNLTLFTYTHRNCADLWEPYLDSLDQYASQIPSVVITNEEYEDYGRHKFRSYDETKNYCEEYVRCLRDSVETKYFIYMQEDFILYGDVNKQALQRYVHFLDEGSCSFVRLIRCGDVSHCCIVDDLYWIMDPSKPQTSLTSFSMQPTIWNKEKFIELYEATKRAQFGEQGFTENMSRLDIRGAYAYNEEPMRKNSEHYDTSVFPYIATAVVRGKWNMLEYSKELSVVFQKYNIDPYNRGIR